MKKEAPPNQMTFIGESGQFSIPEHLSNSPLGRIIIDTLSDNPLFLERPKGEALLINYSDNNEKPSMAIYNPNIPGSRLLTNLEN